MKKFWLVFAHEYWRQVNQKRFLLALLSLPALGVLLVIIAGMSLLFMEDYRPIGYVDYSGLLSNPVDINPEDMTLVRHVQVIRFTDEDKARQALEVDRIQLYFVLDKDYLANGRIRLMAKTPPSEVAISRFSKFLQANLVSQYSDLVKKRLLSQMRLEISTPDQSLRTSDRQWIQFVFPFLSGAMLIIAISTSGGYLLQALTDEKENRTIEIMVTSVSPAELMMGKILGNVCVGLTQLLVWMTYPLWAGVTALFLIPSLKASNFIGLSFWLSLILMLLIFILVSAILAMIGTVMVDHH
ncbi:MAG: ABC transporter permease, partial [Anaerolineales bacterium]